MFCGKMHCLSSSPVSSTTPLSFFLFLAHSIQIEIIFALFSLYVQTLQFVMGIGRSMSYRRRIGSRTKLWGGRKGYKYILGIRFHFRIYLRDFLSIL
jgi:hypothetical protein